MKKRRIMAALLISVMTVSMLNGCKKKEAATGTVSQKAVTATEGITDGEAKEPIKMEWLVNLGTPDVDDESEVMKNIRERFNMDVDVWYIDSAKFNENLSIRFAAGEMPDVLRLEGANLRDYVEGGILHELPIDMIRKKAPNYAKTVDMYNDGTMWTTYMYNDKNYGLVQPLEQAPMAFVWNKVWLNNVGITKTPETLEEVEIALKKFVEEDPDGNGKRDTAGMAERAMNGIFGAYGLRITAGATPGFMVEDMQLDDNGVPFFPTIRPEAKEALAVLARWYQEGIIDKEFITGENHGGYIWLSHSFINGKIGLTTAQPGHYLTYSADTSDVNNYGSCMKELKALNPDADIVLGKGPVGPEGKSGTECWPRNGVPRGLTTKCFEDPAKVDAFFAFLDACYSDMDFVTMLDYGIEGVDYEKTENGFVRLKEGEELKKRGIMQLSFGTSIPFAENVLKKQTEFTRNISGNSYFRFTPPAVPEYTSSIATLDTLTEKAYYAIITGKKPIDYFDEYVEEFKACGGEAAEKAVQDEYAKLKSLTE